MATVALSVVGTVVGGSVGGPLGARYGQAVGAVLGALIDNSLKKPQQVGRLEDLRLSGSSHGTAIPWGYGTVRLPGNVVWWKQLKETKRKKGSKLLGTRTTTYSYSADLAVQICRGPVTAIKKIWAEDTVLYDSVNGPPPSWIHLYLGTDSQPVDPTIAAQETAGAAPAYRGRAYVVFDDLPLAEYGNRVPNFSFLVERLPPYEEIILADGPLLYYRWEDTPGLLADRGALDFDLSVLVGATSQVTGQHGEAISSASVTDLGDTVGMVADLVPTAFTVETWFQYKGGSPTTDGASRIRYQNLTPSNAQPWDLLIQPNLVLNELNIQFIIDPAGTAAYVTVHNHSFTRDAIWHHVAVVHQVNGSSILYLDGVAVSTQTSPATMVITSDPSNRVFVRITSNIRFDETAFYSKLLDAATVAYHYAPSGIRLKDVLSDVFDECGLLGGEYDVATATDLVRGLEITERTEARNAIETALKTYFTDLTEGDGKLKAVKRGGAVVRTIDADEMGAELVESGGLEPEATLQIERRQDLELPFRVSVLYKSATNQYQQAEQAAMRYAKQHVQQQVSVGTNLVFTDDEARQVAERLLYLHWLERETFETSLPPAYLNLLPADPVNLPVPGGTARVRLQELNAGLPGALRCRFVLDEPNTLTQTATAGAITTSPDPAAVVIATTLLAWSNNAGRDADADTVGLYLAANGSLAGFWDGCTVFVSRDAGASYQELQVVQDGATFGTTTTVLAAYTGTGTFDDTNTVDITLTAGTDSPPVTRSDAELLAGENGAVIGDEYLQYGTVTPLGGNSYRLSHLLRGRRGTNHYWDKHKTGERAVVDNGGIIRVELNLSDNGAQLLLKALGSNQQLTDVPTPVTAHVYGRELLAYSPITLAGSRDGSQNLTVTWIRRARKNFDLQPYSEIPLDYALERYQISYLRTASTSISNITQAAQCVVTVIGHNFSVGQYGYFENVGGMIEINGLIGLAVSISGSDVTFDIDTRDFSAYTTGGDSWRAGVTDTVTAPTASFTAAAQTAEYGSPQNPIRVVVRQLNDQGVGGYTLVGNV